MGRLLSFILTACLSVTAVAADAIKGDKVAAGKLAEVML